MRGHRPGPSHDEMGLTCGMGPHDDLKGLTMNVLDFRCKDEANTRVAIIDYDFMTLYEGGSWGIPDDLLKREIRKLEDDDETVIYLTDDRRYAYDLTSISDWTAIVFDWGKPVGWRDRAGYLWNRFMGDVDTYRDAVTICDLGVASYAYDDMKSDLVRVCEFCGIRHDDDSIEVSVMQLVNDFMTGPVYDD